MPELVYGKNLEEVLEFVAGLVCTSTCLVDLTEQIDVPKNILGYRNATMEFTFSLLYCVQG